MESGGEGGRKRRISKSPVFQDIAGIRDQACVAGNVAASLLDDASGNQACEHFIGGRCEGRSDPQAHIEDASLELGDALVGVATRSGLAFLRARSGRLVPRLPAADRLRLLRAPFRCPCRSRSHRTSIVRFRSSASGCCLRPGKMRGHYSFVGSAPQQVGIVREWSHPVFTPKQGEHFPFDIQGHAV